MIRIWQSFACNNSSSYRLVGRFDSVEAATAAELELRAFLDDPDPMLETLTRPGAAHDAELAARYGLLDDIRAWGGEPPVYDDTIELGREGEVLVVYHSYCLGFPEALPAYLRGRGAAVERQRAEVPTISLLFARSAAIDAELDEILRSDPPVGTPWGTSRGDVTHFRDANTIGLVARIEMRDLAACRRWFAARGIAPVLRLCEDGDEARFAAIAAARCTACSGALEYLDPRLHDIETPQLLCRPCGGFYELAALLPP